MTREARRLITQTVESEGGEVVAWGRGKRHPWVEVRAGRRTYKTTFPSSPSDKRWIKNKVAELRRFLRQ